MDHANKSLEQVETFTQDEKTIRFTDSDYFAFPKLRWTACHFRQLMPNVAVQNGSAGSTSLPVVLDAEIEDVTFTPLARNKEMTWNEAFDANYSDRVLVTHKGRVVYERYGGCLNETKGLVTSKFFYRPSCCGRTTVRRTERLRGIRSKEQPKRPGEDVVMTT